MILYHSLKDAALIGGRFKVRKKHFMVSIRHLNSLLSCPSAPPHRESPDFDPNCSSKVTQRSALSSGCIDYVRGWAWQYLILNRRLMERRRQADETRIVQKDDDTVLIFEHRPVYTLGRGADENNLSFLKEGSQQTRELLARGNRGSRSARLALNNSTLFEQDLIHRSDHDAVDRLIQIATPVIAPNGVPIFRVERGGEVTFHGPGQLVVYFLFDLHREPFRKDLHWFLRMVEEVIIGSLGNYGIEATRDVINTGVWVGSDKIAAVGVSSSRWITTHGFALNVNPDLSYFDTSIIIPCGINGRGVTSMAEVLAKRGVLSTPTLKEVSEVVLKNIRDVFHIEIESADSLH